MNKKFLCGALALLMTGALFVTACGETGDNSGNSGNSGNQSGTNNGMGDPTVKPGTVITDEETKKALLGAVTQTELKGLTFSGSFNLSVTAEGATQSRTITAEGASRFGTAVEADLFASLEAGEEEGQYYLLFVREGAAYQAGGDGDLDFTSLKAQLKDKDDPLPLDKTDFGKAQDLLGSAGAVRLLKNLTALSEGVITKTEGGYSLEYDVIGGAEDLLSGAETLAEAVDRDADMTLSALFGQPFVKDTLGVLLEGITAEDLTAAAAPFLPEEIASALPAAGNSTALGYLESCLRSGAFYTAVTGGAEPWDDYKTFGEVPLGKLAGILSGGEFDLGAYDLKELVHGLKEGLKEKLFGLVCNLISLEGDAADETAGIALRFSFDDNRKLLGFGLDALVTGSVTAPAAPPTTSPEEGGGAPETETLPAAKRSAGTQVRVSLKLETTCASAPELFDLSGCKLSEGGTIK